MGIHQRRDDREEIERDLIIGAEKRHEIAAGERQPVIERLYRPTAFRVAHDTNVAVPRNDLLDDLEAAVGRCVIDNDNLVGWPRLAQHRADRRRQIAGVIVVRHDE